MLKIWRPLEEDFGEALRIVPAWHKNDIAVDVLEEKDNVIIEVHVAGIDPDKIDISLEHNNLRISGKREESYVSDEPNFYCKEIQRGSFERVVELPVPVDAAKVMAEAKHGLLRIVLPKMHPTNPKKITIHKK